MPPLDGTELDDWILPEAQSKKPVAEVDDWIAPPPETDTPRSGINKIGAVARAAARGYREGFEGTPRIPTPEEQEALTRTAEQGGLKGAGAQVLSTFLEDMHAPLAVGPGLFRAGQAAVQQIGKELGDERLGREAASYPEAFLGMRGLRPRPGEPPAPTAGRPRVEPTFGEPSAPGGAPVGPESIGPRPRLEGPPNEPSPTAPVAGLPAPVAPEGQPPAPTAPAGQLALPGPAGAAGRPWEPVAPSGLDDWLPVDTPTVTEAAVPVTEAAEPAPPAPTTSEVPASDLKPGDQVVVGDQTLEVEKVRPWVGDDIAIKLKGDPKLQIGSPDSPVQKVSTEEASPQPVEAFGGPWNPVLDKDGAHAKNRQGEPLFENDNGLRATMEGSVPYHESAIQDPDKGMVPRNPVDRRGQFLTAEETGVGAKPAPKPEAKTEAEPKPEPQKAPAPKSKETAQLDAGADAPGKSPIKVEQKPPTTADTDKPAPVAKVDGAPDVPKPTKLTEAQGQALRKAHDLLKHGTALRELFFHPRMVEAFIRDGVMERTGGHDGLRLTDKGLALAGMEPRPAPKGEPSEKTDKDRTKTDSDRPASGSPTTKAEPKPEAAPEPTPAEKPKPPSGVTAFEATLTGTPEHPGIRLKNLRDGKETVIQPPGTVAPASPEAPAEPPAPETVTHVTKKGKTLTGTIRKDLSLDEAKALDPYTFKKDGGYFIRAPADLVPVGGKKAAAKPETSKPAPKPEAAAAPPTPSLSEVIQSAANQTPPTATLKNWWDDNLSPAGRAFVMEAAGVKGIDPNTPFWKLPVDIRKALTDVRGVEGTPDGWVDEPQSQGALPSPDKAPTALSAPAIEVTQTPEEAFAEADAAYKAQYPLYQQAKKDHLDGKISDDEYFAVRGEHDRLRDALGAAQDALPDADALETERRIKAGIEEVALDEAYQQADDPALAEQMDDIREMLKSGWSPGDIAAHPGIDRTPREIRALHHVWREQGQLSWQDRETGQAPLPLTAQPIPSSLDVAEQQAKKSAPQAPETAVADWVAGRLGQQMAPGVLAFSANEAAAYAASVLGKTLAEGLPRDWLYDAIELGVNTFITRHPERFAPTGDLASAQAAAVELAALKDRIPTQTVRAGDKVKLQQFSTPPDYAFAASWAANLRPGEVVIEPSAGTGGIAVHAMNAGAKVVGNEISAQRRAMMATLPFSRITAENAEQLHNILSRDIRPTAVVMNPPFSSAGDRMGGKMVLETGAVHIEQALKRLEPGGRLVAIVGDGMKPEGAATAGKGGRNNATGAAFRDWWKKIGAQYDVRANIGVGGEIYRKYGTTFPTRLLVIDKVAPSGKPPVVTTALTSAELLDALQGVRDARPGSAGEQVANQPGGTGMAPQGQGASGPGEAVRPPTGDVGPGSGPNLPSAPDRPKPTGARGGQTGGVRTGGGARPGGDVRGDAPVVRQPEPHPQGGAGQPAVQPPTSDIAPGSGPGDDTGHLRPDGSDLTVSPPAPELLETSIVVPEEQTGGELTESVYEDYRPQRITIEGAQPHPGPLVQSAAMASVLPPAVTYKTALPKKLITEGAVSAAQLEAIVYAGNAHSQTLEKDKDNVIKRRGFFIGDGTGVGKGREVAGIILDNKWQGRKKAIWVSEKMPLSVDAKRDWAGLGQNPNEILVHAKIKAGDEIKHDSILFTTYDTLKSGEKFGTSADKLAPGMDVVVKEKNEPTAGKLMRREGENWIVEMPKYGKEMTVSAKDIAPKEPKSRVQQIVDWLGKDFDGVIAFDEAHNMANVTGGTGTRGKKDAAAKALAGLELQNALPNARVVYVSATGATEVSNLAYADRLGLWGPGTAFANRNDFLSRVAQGGVAAMELVARDMKALGYYTARSLSYDGVEYDRVQHDLTPPQRVMYDKIADAWQLVLRNMMAALEDTGANGKGGPKSAILSAFWGGHQRFFNQLITSLQMPSVIAGIDKDLAEGRQAVLQLVNTNEAGQERAIDKSKARGDEDLEELDMSPRDQLLQLVDKAFPIWQYESYVDADGNERVRLVIDSEGNKVANPDAVVAKEKLLLDLGSLRVPDGPLEILVNHYGPEAVAEVTGRKQRVVNKADETGRMKKTLEKRGADANVAEANAFQGGKKKILIFSQAGGTGRSYHDDKTADRVDDTGRLGIGGNGARRSHYLVQAGWRADTAVQGFGRTHRTNQWTAPIFHLVTTDLEGQKRFISSIARRLGQLGALTKGERRTGDQGMFGLQDNLESDEAKAGLVQLFRDIHGGRVQGFTTDDLAEQMGLSIEGPGGELKDELPPMTQFLNRVLSLKVDDQNRVFNEFATRFRDIVDRAAAAGTLDAGTETYKADTIAKVSDQVVYTDPNSGAETRHVHLKTGTRNYPASFGDIMSGQSKLTGWQAPEFFIQNKRSGLISAVSPTTFTRVEPNGAVTEHYRVSTPLDSQFVPKDDLMESLRADGNRTRITDQKEAKTLWDARVAKTPEFHEADLHIITGAILPIWDRLSGQPKIFRLQTDAGERMLGRVVDNKVINKTLERLGAEGVKLDIKPSEIVERILDGQVATLANEWTIKRRRVAQEWRLELTGTDLYSHTAELEAAGVFRERIPGTYDTRYFIPTGAGRATTIEAITKRRPIISVEGD